MMVTCDIFFLVCICVHEFVFLRTIYNEYGIAPVPSLSLSIYICFVFFVEYVD